MPTNDERRDVAAMLRELAADYEKVPAWSVIASGELPAPIDDAFMACGLGRAIHATEICNRLADLIEPELIDGDTSDGYHTFNELYDHRAKLFSVVVAAFSNIAWKSKRHSDGSMYEGMFIVGIDTPHGQATYHYEIEPYWELFRCSELPKAPEFDGHTPAQAIDRIASLADLIEPEERTCRMKLSDCTDSLGQKMYRCSECGALMTDDACFFEGEPDIDWFSYCPNCGAKVVDDHA